MHNMAAGRREADKRWKQLIGKEISSALPLRRVFCSPSNWHAVFFCFFCGVQLLQRKKRERVK
jgi:hypothetical protein